MAFADALRPMWLAGLTASKGARKVTTETFLHAGVAHINCQPSGGKFSMYVSNTKKIVELFSHEADRFATAAFESLCSESTLTAFPRSTGWQLIRGYYAAFFALHSLIRMHGWACTRLNKEVSASLDKNAKVIFPQGDRIEGGLYFVKAAGKSPELAFEHLGTKSGGTHEVLWTRVLPEFLAEITDLALNSSADEEAAQDLVRAVNQFRSLIGGKGGAIWFTRVRNLVNYSHAFGTWHPYAHSTCDVRRVACHLERWRSEPSSVLSLKTSDELLQFSEACAFVVSLCRATMKDLVFRSKPNSPFRLSTARFLDA